MGAMPELPEVEITARLLDRALSGRRIDSALAPGINVLKTFSPQLSELEGLHIEQVGRRGKHLTVMTDGGLTLLMHLMSAGRLQLYGKQAGLRDRTSRLLLRIAPEGETDSPLELRLREFGSKQAAWVKLLADEELDADEALATLGPEAWPDPGSPAALKELLKAPRPLHTQLRDQRVIAGIGRSWVDEILWQARLSPYKRGADLEEAEAEALRESIVQTLGGALEQYENELSLPLPDKLPQPLQIHRHEGQPCPRCGSELKAVHFEDYVIAYCPTCQTEGRELKDRRLSRLLR
jgi:formamidopyrimidine-DNA glycosylase